jgi:hypothetical protein
MLAMKANDYLVLRHALEEGCAYGVHRYYKHRDGGPDSAEMREMADEICEHVLNSVCEWFNFEDTSL